MSNLWDFFSHEAGQKRRNWLDTKMQGVADAARYYAGPYAPNLGLVGEMNPVQDVGYAMQDARAGDYVGMLTNTAAAVAPAVAGKVAKAYNPRMADDAAQWLEDALMGISVNPTRAGMGNAAGDFVGDESGVLSLRKDASDTFGAGHTRATYTDPETGGIMEMLERPDGSASTLELLVPEGMRGQGGGQRLLEEVMGNYDRMGGQVSSKAAAVNAYRAGRRPPDMPNATLDDVFAIMDDMSSVNLVTPPKLTPAQTEAQNVLDLLSQGKGASVTDDMLAASDDMYLFDNYDLPMDEASRMARKDAGGYIDGYHGSTHFFDGFGGGNTRNTEGHFGAGDYLTSSADDASVHYAGEGPDLTQRIQLRAEQIADDLGVEYDSPKALAAARAELSGGTDGIIYPVSYRTDKVFDASSGGDTWLGYEQPRMDPSDYLDEAGGDMDVAEELALDDSYNFEPEGDLVEFMNSLSWDRRIDDSGSLLDEIQENALDGGMSARDLDKIMRGNEWYAYGDNGDMVNNEVFRNALSDNGFDAIRHDGDIFPGMEIEGGTVHSIINNPANIRSRFARFDPRLKHLSNLSAGIAGIGLLGSAFNTQDQGY